MENYIGRLNDDELKEACKIITADKLREAYSSNYKRFTKISGYDPNALTDEQVYIFIVKHRGNDFARRIFNTLMHECMSTIPGELRNTELYLKLTREKGSVEEMSDDDIEVHSTWQELLKTAELELSSAGASEDGYAFLSRFLYSAYTRKVPVMLAGPNAVEIASAFSASLCGRTPDVLSCEGSFSRGLIDQCRDSEAEIIVIKNMFYREWYYHVIDMLSRREKLYIPIHPFPEDLKLEPASLMNYCLPVITEMLVERPPEKSYIGGRRSDTFTAFVGSPSAEEPYSQLLNQLRISPLARNTIRYILADMRKMGSTKSHDMFLLQSVAYVVGELDVLGKFMGDEE